MPSNTDSIAPVILGELKYTDINSSGTYLKKCNLQIVIIFQQTASHRQEKSYDLTYMKIVDAFSYRIKYQNVEKIIY